MRRRFAAGVASCILLGLAVLAIEHLPDPWSTASRLGGPWLAMAFYLGRRSPSLGAGAITGSLGLVLVNASYYAWKQVWESELNPTTYDDQVFWFGIAAIAGALFGGLGRISVAPGRFLPTAAAALLGGVMMSESFWVIRWIPLRVLIVVVGILVAVVLPHSPRERVFGLIAAGITCAAVLFGLEAALSAASRLRY